MMEKLSSDIATRCKWFDQNYSDIKARIAVAAEKSGRRAKDIILLAATKTVPAEVINHAIECGINYIGENRVQEFLAKKDDLSVSAHRHFIGHLQTNKVKDIIDEVEMIQSVHSIKLAKEINRLAEKRNKVMDILCEVNIGNEESKSGFSSDEILEKIEEISNCTIILAKKVNSLSEIAEWNLKAEWCINEVVPAMNELRKACDSIEPLVDKKAWPMPSYTEILHRI